VRSAQEIEIIIKAELKSKNITSKEMLSSVGLNKNVLVHMKNGSMPSADKLWKIAQYLDISMDYLMESDDEKL